MHALRRRTRVLVLTGLCVGLFACLGGVRFLDGFTWSAAVSGAGSVDSSRATTVSAAPSGENCECCTSGCSVLVDRARATLDMAGLLALWTVIAAGAVTALTLADPRHRLLSVHARGRWWCHPSPTSLCVILG